MQLAWGTFQFVLPTGLAVALEPPMSAGHADRRLASLGRQLARSLATHAAPAAGTGLGAQWAYVGSYTGYEPGELGWVGSKNAGAPAPRCRHARAPDAPRPRACPAEGSGSAAAGGFAAAAEKGIALLTCWLRASAGVGITTFSFDPATGELSHYRRTATQLHPPSSHGWPVAQPERGRGVAAV